MIKSIHLLKVLCSGILILLQAGAYAQYSERQLVDKIQSFQVHADEFYDSGLFPTDRTWSFSSKPVKDNTIFFTASIISTLKMIYGDLDSESQNVVDSVILNSELLYPKYKNRGGGITSNFWQTVAPDLPFPNGSKLISNEKLRLPDDFDSSVLIALAQGKNDSTDALLRERITAYSARKNRNDVKLYTADEYSNVLAYETWFGKDMPQTFDLCVMSNVLLYVATRDFELNAYDSATISLIRQMIMNNDHIERTSDVSHHSNSPALVLYHVARFISMDKNGLVDDLRVRVIADLERLSTEVENEVEKVMIASSLARLGQKTSYAPNIEKLNLDTKTFSFFSVNPFNISKGKSRYLPSVTWICEAYNWVLVLELYVLQKRN